MAQDIAPTKPAPNKAYTWHQMWVVVVMIVAAVLN